MGNSCVSKPKLSALLEVILQDVFKFFPLLKAAYILRSDGYVISFAATNEYKSTLGIATDKRKKNPPQLPEGVLSAIEALKKTVAAFGTLLSHGDSQVMHVRGKQQMFSYYFIQETGGYFIVLYSDLPANTQDIPDTAEVDENMNVIISRVAETLRISDKR